MLLLVDVHVYMSMHSHRQYGHYSCSAFKYGSRVTVFIIVKVSLCYSNEVSRLLDRNALSDCMG